MKKILFHICMTIGVVGGFFVCYQVATVPVYQEYEKLWEARRLHPELLPNKTSIVLSTAGHSHTYADSLWINLIQYIGDNIGNGKYKDYIEPLVGTISDVHPQFTRPYTLALLMAPDPVAESTSYEQDRVRAESAVRLGERGMSESCDTTQVAKIRNTEMGARLWSDTTLANPCTDGMIPYYLAAVMSNLGKHAEAEKLYKIASVQSDAPQASRFLSVLERAETGDLRSAATRFLLIALEGYDEDGKCQESVKKLLGRYQKSLPVTTADIAYIGGVESELTPPKDKNNPLSQGSTSCYESTRRGIKQLYLGYITEQGKKYPEANTAEELIKIGAIASIPRLADQKEFTIKKQKDGSWAYRQK